MPANRVLLLVLACVRSATQLPTALAEDLSVGQQPTLEADALVARPECAITVFNNPAVQGKLYNPYKDEHIPLKGFPWVKVQLEELPSDGPVSLRLVVCDSSHQVISERSEVLSPKGRTVIWPVTYDHPLVHPLVAELDATQGERGWHFAQETRLHRLSGRVTDFDGAPVAAFVVAIGYDGLAALAGADGNYEIWLPEVPLPSLVVVDQQYGSGRIETWVYGYHPRHDLQLNVRMGEIEVYELQAWRANCGLKADFIPLSLGLANRLREAMGEDFSTSAFNRLFGSLVDAKAFLNREDIAVDLDGEPLRVTGSWERQDLLPGGKTEAEQSRPEYSLQLTDKTVTGKPGTTQVLRLTITRQRVDGDRIATERGEGYYLGLRSGWTAVVAGP
jgi:hypothetical protein